MQRPIKFMEGSNGTARGKRGLDSSDAGEAQRPESKKQKVPALASVIVEALKVDSLQKLCSSLEPILRRVVSEEVERALAKLGPAMVGGRSSPKQIEGPDGRSLQLQFRSRLSLSLFTGGKVEGEQGAAIHVVLIDASTGIVVTSGPESCMKLDVVVLEGDFNNEDDDDWTQEDFESHMVKERDGKRPLLTGDLQVSLKEGVGSLGELTFTDNSSWIRSRKFRLGVKVAPGFCQGVRVREAKTDAFTVKDHRGELYKKHYPPALDDDVWRLEKIGKDGSFHKKLNEAGIHKVEDFLRLVVRDSQRLRNILGSGMSNKMWDVLVEHAKTCALSGKHYVYYADKMKNTGIVFNNIYELSGLITGGQYRSAETILDSEKVFVDTLVKKAYENWMHVVEYDGRMLLNMKPNKRASSSQPEVLTDGSTEYPVSFDRQVSLLAPRFPALVPIERASVNSGVVVGGDIGYNEHFGNRYQIHSQHSNGQMQLENSSFGQQIQLMGSSHQTQITRNDNSIELALGPHESASCFEFQPIGPSGHPSNLGSYDVRSSDPYSNRGAEELFSEDEIRMRSHEMLEHDDMQQLLRVISMGGASVNVSNDTYPYSSYIQSPYPSYEEDRKSSGKAVVGWLKLKAALRWGIFIRKQAAERRAQLVELDD